MTLKQIAKNNNLDYGLVYNGAWKAGVLKRFAKNAEYDEEEVLCGVAVYLSERIEKYLKKVAELTNEREPILCRLGISE